MDIPTGFQRDGWRTRKVKGLPAMIGPLMTREEGDKLIWGVQLFEEHANVQGVVHGGVLTTFADHALTLNIWEAVGRHPLATSELTANFLAAARPPCFLELESEILKRGRTVIFARGLISENGALVAHVSGSWNLLSRPPTDP